MERCAAADGAALLLSSLQPNFPIISTQAERLCRCSTFNDQLQLLQGRASNLGLRGIACDGLKRRSSGMEPSRWIHSPHEWQSG